MKAMANISGIKAVRVLEKILYPHLYPNLHNQYQDSVIIEQAMKLLGEIKTTAACDVLLSFAEDNSNDINLRGKALECLPPENGLWNPERILKLMMESFSINPDEYQCDRDCFRLSAKYLLGHNKNTSTISVVSQYIDHEDVGTRRKMVDILSELKQKEAEPFLIHLTEDVDLDIRCKAILGLAKLGYHEVTNLVFRELDRCENYGWAYEDLFLALGELKDERVIPVIEKYLVNNHNPNCSAYDVLAKIGGTRAVDVLINHCNRYIGNKENILKALANIGTPLATKKIIQEIRKEKSISNSSIISFINNPDSTQVLIEILANEKEPGIRYEVVRALGNIRHPAAIPILYKLVEDPNNNVRKAVFDVMMKGIDPKIGYINETLEIFKNALESKVVDRCNFGLRGIEHFPLRYITEDIRLCVVKFILHGADENNINHAISILGKMKNPNTVTFLIQLLENPEFDYCKFSILSDLQTLGDPQAVSTIIDVTNQLPDPPRGYLLNPSFIPKLIENRPTTDIVLRCLALRYNIRITADKRIFLPDGREIPCEKIDVWYNIE